MEKIITIGDIHGRTVWKSFADIKILLMAEPAAAGFGGFEPEYDKYIFIGDYVDSYTETNTTIKNNLLEIIRFKKLYPDNVVLLWGNHDLGYYLNNPVTKENKYGYISGFRPESHFDLYDIFYQNRNLFQFSFGIKNYLWTHAGLHRGWYNHIFLKEIINTDLINLPIFEQLNLAFEQRLDCLFDVGLRRGGHKKVGGPVWLDKELSYEKPLNNYHHIVGHTPSNQISTYYKNKNTSITYCDVLDKKKQFYTIIVK